MNDPLSCGDVQPLLAHGNADRVGMKCKHINRMDEHMQTGKLESNTSYDQALILCQTKVQAVWDRDTDTVGTINLQIPNAYQAPTSTAHILVTWEYTVT